MFCNLNEFQEKYVAAVRTLFFFVVVVFAFGVIGVRASIMFSLLFAFVGSGATDVLCSTHRSRLACIVMSRQSNFFEILS
jgi:hypothetical protein